MQTIKRIEIYRDKGKILHKIKKEEESEKVRVSEWEKKQN